MIWNITLRKENEQDSLGTRNDVLAALELSLGFIENAIEENLQIRHNNLLIQFKLPHLKTIETLNITITGDGDAMAKLHVLCKNLNCIAYDPDFKEKIDFDNDKYWYDQGDVDNNEAIVDTLFEHKISTWFLMVSYPLVIFLIVMGIMRKVGWLQIYIRGGRRGGYVWHLLTIVILIITINITKSQLRKSSEKYKILLYFPYALLIISFIVAFIRIFTK